MTWTISQCEAIRLERARLKRKLGAGELTFEAALAHPAFQTMLLFDLLIHLPNPQRRLRHAKKDRRSSVYAERLFYEIQRGPLTRIEDLSARERRILVYADQRKTLA